MDHESFDPDDFQTALSQALSDEGIPAGMALFAGSPTPDAPPPPDGPWLVFYHDDALHVGASARGAFRPYAVTESGDDAIGLVLGLLTYPPAHEELSYSEEEALARGVLTAQRIHARTVERNGQAGPTQLLKGDLLDALEAETAHTLYPLGTPLEQRSVPPSFADAPLSIYEVREDFEDVYTQVFEGTVAPWFGQPGGGAMVVLDRPIRWYVDRGALIRLVDGPLSDPRTKEEA